MAHRFPCLAQGVSMARARELEREIINECKQSNSKYTDPDFGRNNESIALKSRVLLKHVDHWERKTEHCLSPRPSLFVGGSGSGDVIQGEVGDCWFLGALAMVAQRQDDLLYPLFVSAHPEYGFFQIRFFIDGEWRVVTVDDYVPVKGSSSMIFAHCKNVDEMWVPLVEKAFAKLNWRYEHIASGAFSEGSELYALSPDMAKSNDFWDRLVYFRDEAFLMGCAIEGVGEHDNGMGLLTGHAYGVMNCHVTRRDKVKLVQLFNPWGMKEWTGPWSDGSKEWTPELIKELNQTDEDDGKFWMTYADFLKYFNQFAVCRLLTDDIGKVWEKRIFAGEWTAETAGGCCNHKSWNVNPQYWVRVFQPTQMFFHLARQDTRCVGQPRYKEAIGVYIFKDRIDRRKQHRYRDDVLHTPVHIGSREYSHSCLLQPGEYLLMPTMYEAGVPGIYYFTVYSEDPVEAGLIGQPNQPPHPVQRLDIARIAQLNRPDSDDETAAEPEPQEEEEEEETDPNKCCGCRENLKGGGKFFRYDGRRYHLKCFKCVRCDEALDPSDFYQDSRGRPLCEQHQP